MKAESVQLLEPIQMGHSKAIEFRDENQYYSKMYIKLNPSDVGISVASRKSRLSGYMISVTHNYDNHVTLPVLLKPMAPCALPFKLFSETLIKLLLSSSQNLQISSQSHLKLLDPLHHLASCAFTSTYTVIFHLFHQLLIRRNDLHTIRSHR